MSRSLSILIIRKAESFQKFQEEARLDDSSSMKRNRQGERTGEDWHSVPVLSFFAQAEKNCPAIFLFGNGEVTMVTYIDYQESRELPGF